ncbi:hypothetical protein RYZ20_13835 [Thioclava sp. A2]|uniref:hypothetical protein n=1 Tax=Thioclava sp. FCG-A2 TaxID=3080562 RepID=UPI002954408D|nr:hypothetical protein [Thioclava sp. A2]MDV7271971.1 hypothetical protein [Thioclava sp. A2]
MEFERIWSKRPYAVDFLDGEGGDLVISFSSVGHDPSRLPSPEFVATAIGRGAHGPPRRALFVMDESRSWANAEGFAEALLSALATVRSRAPVDRIVAMGVSMGGFCALAASQVIPVDAVLAFSPQWSVVPDVVPDERRWSIWTENLPPVRWRTAPLPETAWVCLFHGAKDDMAQAAQFPAGAGLDHLIFPDHGHSDLVDHLKERGALAGMLDATLRHDRRRLLRIVASAGGRRRGRG